MILVVAALVEVTSALVCTPMLCEEMTEQPVLNCQGGIIKGGGFCGCTDACAKVEGEVCQAVFHHGIIPAGTCDLGLRCQQQDQTAFGRGVCVKTEPDVDLGLHRVAVEREVVKRERTLCEERRLAGLMTMVIWAGKWIAKCDADGNFLPEQCDVSGHCFCVSQDGTVIAGTKVQGPADCSNVDVLTTTALPEATSTGPAVLSPAVRQLSTHAQTKCEQMRLHSLMSMVVWSGKWTPTCDSQGNFTPHQCYFSGLCFCVTPDGVKIEGSEGLSDCSSYLQNPTTTDSQAIASA